MYHYPLWSRFLAYPLNYTIRIGHTDLIETIDAIGGGLNTGKWGNGMYLSILRAGVKTTVYGQNSLLFDWNAYNSASNFATKFEMNGLPGLWDMQENLLHNAMVVELLLYYLLKHYLIF